MKKSWILLILLGLTTFLPASHASLGESIDSIEADLKTLRNGRLLPRAHSPRFSVHPVKADNLLLKEFVSQNGAIFAFSWEGNIHPELKSMLGRYLSEYENGLNSSPKIRGLKKHVVRTQRLLIEYWGHPRHLQGRAIAADLLPQGVKLDEIQ